MKTLFIYPTCIISLIVVPLHDSERYIQSAEGLRRRLKKRGNGVERGFFHNPKVKWTD